MQTIVDYKIYMYDQKRGKKEFLFAFWGVREEE